MNAQNEIDGHVPNPVDDKNVDTVETAIQHVEATEGKDIHDTGFLGGATTVFKGDVGRQLTVFEKKAALINKYVPPLDLASRSPVRSSQ